MSGERREYRKLGPREQGAVLGRPEETGMRTHTLRSLIAVAIIAFGTAAIAQMAMGPAMTAATAAGTVLVGPNGMTLYTWDNDTPGVSNCNGGCATNWPPFYAEAGAMAEGDWTIVTRDDGTLIWAYDGLPLYYFARDTNPGDVNGNQPDGTWHVVVVDAAM
jgi:predicted lipoprotein with Yx(FWY)xxD motif